MFFTRERIAHRCDVGLLQNVPFLIYGWETWIRTKVDRSRAGSSTAKLSPNHSYDIISLKFTQRPTIYISKRFMLPLLHHSILIIHIIYIVILIIVCYNVY